ncbi:glycosyltransferase family 4 protein [Ancylothrix sp. C2]|uniref:glycosyltransferase family 4 protein n=1 Tax=Ancylothrix sp. D3o TaxID=2953691 RepID=UPI0021BAD02C|nr:glycosyltransferase family 4 protein [Ancylothrix sp. D3o]MCT7951466.1 glycosyltransferase family 4 protein [Ancylothrix sp. D3o]
MKTSFSEKDDLVDEKEIDVFVFLEVFCSEGGIQSYVKDLLKAYSSIEGRKAEVFILRDSPDSDIFFASEFLKFHFLKTSPASFGRIRLAFSLASFLLLKRPRRLFCGHVKLAPLIHFLCTKTHIPYTVLTYGKEVWEPLKGSYQRALLEAEEIWTISRYSRDKACEANALNPEKFKILPCAVDGEVFTPARKSLTLLEKYNLKDSRVLMTVARLWSGDIYKGVDVTIQALPEIAQKVKNVKYLVIGRGDDRPRLEKIAEELGVRDKVVFAGFVASEELVEHYRLADVYVMPSHEGFGIVYLEAMACGVPVVAGDADGSADPLLDGKLGWRVPHRDAGAVALACLEALEGKDSRCDGEWLRNEMIKNFGKDAFEGRFKQMLDL